MDLTIILPTYDERKNLPRLVPEILRYVPDAEIIVVDDNSPDGTGRIAEILRERYGLKVIHRKKRLGLATAVVAGFRYAKGDILGVMEADMSHPPSILPKMLRLIEQDKADIVIASRKLKGSRVEGWPMHRRFVSDIASILANLLTKVSDPLSGYFFLRKQVIKDIKFQSRGYKILLEVLKKGNYSRVTEIPYIFRGREFGSSKLSLKENLLFLVDYYKLIKKDTNYR